MAYLDMAATVLDRLIAIRKSQDHDMGGVLEHSYWTTAVIQYTHCVTERERETGLVIIQRSPDGRTFASPNVAARGVIAVDWCAWRWWSGISGLRGRYYSTTVNIRGESYRLKDKKRAGVFTVASGKPTA